MTAMSTGTLEQILRAAAWTPGANGRWGLPLLLRGKPGIGKSRRVEKAARDAGLPVWTLIGSIREPSDFGGLPVPVEDGRAFAYAVPVWAKDAADAGRALIFVDEVSTCAPSVQAALLRMVLDGAVGDFMLPPTVRFFLAMNEAEDAAGGWEIAPPLANRLGHLVVDAPEAGAWADWMSGAEDSWLGAPEDGDGEQDERPEMLAEALEAKVVEAWPAAFARARGLAAAFLRRRPELLFRFPKGKADGAWPSPRSWELATRALAGAKVHGLPEAARDEFVAAFVGQAAAAEFLAFAEDADLPDPEALLDGKVRWEPERSRPDRTAAVLSACATVTVATRDETKRKARAERAWELIGVVAEGEADLAIPAARALMQGKAAPTPKQRKILGALFDVLEAARTAKRGA